MQIELVRQEETNKLFRVTKDVVHIYFRETKTHVSNNAISFNKLDGTYIVCVGLEETYLLWYIDVIKKIAGGEYAIQDSTT